ncbi:ABC-type nitrate/sulfonate/bicarbonate transport system, permease component [Synechococcus sp. PCC 7502]|uniref:ABC transporter permease n=1 Tax=Synechococcus sp. PCC 7502 TaxID=1173263 RepID=UPI00029FA7A5|nr:ABC transporter permease [Synechococcus sp. PCC 7502]AFY74849.1 ABC-type nitrate/sulfonate/bicarbonate transport system, permease component [Synechococcus sp. PCC 7502]
MVESSFIKPDSEPRQYRYLSPSVFWSIRQGFPQKLSLLLVGLSLIIPLTIWTVVSSLQIISPTFLPTPWAVVAAGYKMFTEANLLADIVSSSGRVLAGFVLAAVIGVPIGLAMGTFYSMDSLFTPIVGTVRYMPVTGFVPLIIIWVGLGEPSKILIIMLGVVLYNAIMVADAVKFIPNEMINVAYTMGANRWDVLVKVIIPATFPCILDTLRVNISGAWNFLVIAELLAAQNGLGFKIIQAQRFLQTEKVLFCIVLIGVIGLAIDYGLKYLSSILTPWADEVRH